MIELVLLDLDGVVRHFDPGHVAAVEHKHGLRSGVLTQTAFSPTLLTPAITGLATREQWVHNIGESVRSHEAATEWMADRGSVDSPRPGSATE